MFLGVVRGRLSPRFAVTYAVLEGKVREFENFKEGKRRLLMPFAEMSLSLLSLTLCPLCLTHLPRY